MKIFISHANKDEKLALALAAFLESIDASVEVFCTSQAGSIKVGRDYVSSITKELNMCDAFIPLLSPNYYESRFCMIELGFAYAILFSKYDDEYNYIFPLATYPIKKAEALINTPLAQLQVASIIDIEDIRSYVESLIDEKNIKFGSGLNKKINAFVHDIKKCVFERIDVMAKAKVMVCKSAEAPGEDSDYMKYSIMPEQNGYTINFKAKPTGTNSYPNFLSFVIKYVDKLNLYETANYFENSKLKICINNDTNSIRRIDIQIKYSDNNNILNSYSTILYDGINNIAIPLQEIKSEALKNVSEICFVIKPSSYIEAEGMMQVFDIRVENF